VEDYQSTYWIEVMNPQHNMLRRAFIMNRGIERDTLRFAPAVSAKMEANDTLTDNSYVRFTAIDGDGKVFDTSSSNRLVWIVLPHGNAKVGNDDNKRWMMYGNLAASNSLNHGDVQDLIDNLDAKFEVFPNAINVAAGILSGVEVGGGGTISVSTGDPNPIVVNDNTVRTWTSGTDWVEADNPKNADNAAVLEFAHARYFDIVKAEGARIILLAFNEHFFNDTNEPKDFIQRPFFYTSIDVSGSTFDFCEVLGDWEEKCDD
jgi:hypothetical protein